MPGKHAPESPRSFYVSVARAAAGAIGAVALVVAIIVVAINSRSEDGPSRAGGSSPTATGKATTSPTPTPSAAAAPALRPRSKVTILVLNGTTRNGLAARVTARLDKDGYAVKAPTNAPEAQKTTVYYKAKAEADAREFLRAHAEFGRVKLGTGRFDTPALLVIVLGSDYDRND